MWIVLLLGAGGYGLDRALTNFLRGGFDEQLDATLTALVHREMPDTFTAWLQAAGLHDIEPLAVDHFDSGALMLEAAAQGLGVAFMLETHFESARDERLAHLRDLPRRELWDLPDPRFAVLQEAARRARCVRVVLRD